LAFGFISFDTKDKKEINKDAILVQVVNEEHYETPEYKKQQAINAMNYFKQLSDTREELEKRHG
jgi:ribosomal protein S21